MAEIGPQRLMANHNHERVRSRRRWNKVRLMIPMSIICSTCDTSILRGTKRNGHKEDVIGEIYMGIQSVRFYFKCCGEITIKTDAENRMYVLESGARLSLPVDRQVYVPPRLPGDLENMEHID